jgi:hypothetical protein
MRKVQSRMLLFVSAALSTVLVVPMAGRSAQGRGQAGPPGREPAELKVLHPMGHGQSQVARDLARLDLRPEFEAPEPGKTRPDKPAGGGGGNGNTDPVLQTSYPNSAPPVVLQTFGGITWTGSVPPDTNVAVGDTQVMLVVNSQFMVYEKSSGNALMSNPAPIKSLFASLGSDPCATYGGGDPVFLFDRLAHRWVTTHYTFTPNYMCSGISDTTDATGTYHVYSYSFGPNTADYAKFGVWPDGYYMSANTFAPSGGFIGRQACAFDRVALLAGAQNPAVVCFQSSNSWPSLLPADLDSATPPPAGAPNYFVNLGSNGASLNLYEFHADFQTPSNSSMTGPKTITVAKFDQPCGACVPQPGVKETLETLGSRLMFRLSYRNFGAYESLLVNHAVQVAQNSNKQTQTGIRWYELRNPGGTPVAWQQSTFSPDTSIYRWMGSLAQDKQGNIFLGYSASSSAVFPSIRYTGRLATDPAGQMQHENVLVTGLGSQVVSPNSTSGRDRWGDYASVAVDPTDGCTFWFATEYLTFSGYGNWATHLVSAKFGGCS